MSWLFSQVLVEEYLGENFSDGEQSVPLNGKPIQQAYCAPDKMTGFSRLSRFGMTYKPLTETRGEELLTLYREVFHAKTSVPRGGGQGSLETNLQCGNTWQGLLAKLDPNTSLWKIPQCSLFEDLELSLQTWPRWGLMQDGVCWEQIPSVRVTTEKEFGYWPTPTATDWKATGRLETLKRQGNNLEAGGQNRPQYHYSRLMNMKMPVSSSEMLMLWPIEWTDLKPLETDKSHCAQPPHGES